MGEGSLDDPQRRHHVRPQRALEVVGPQAGDPRQRARAEGARVVHQEVEAALVDGRADEAGHVDRVADVAREGDDAAGAGGVDLGAGGLEGDAVAGVDDEVPAVGGEGGGEGPTEAPAGTGDECGSAHLALRFVTF